THEDVVGVELREVVILLNTRLEVGQTAIQWSWPPRDDVDESDHKSMTIRLAKPVPMTLKASLRPLRAAGVQAQAVMALADVTDEVENSRFKTRFLSAAAHELRSPLTVISGYSDLLRNVGDDEKLMAEALDALRDESSKMTGLINELLAISRVGALGVRVLNLATIDVKIWMENWVARAMPPKERHRISSLGPDDNVVLSADDEMLHRALVNVVSNACKYSEADAPVVITTVLKDGDVNISVRDYGIGMTADSVSRVGEPFFRVKVSRAVGGTGLGMALVREIVAAHGGTIHVSSTPGRGTTVMLSLPQSPRA
ncbi:MAG: signal transduction histidine kinase, partial [Gammaproteobacteria bacterium]